MAKRMPKDNAKMRSRRSIGRTEREQVYRSQTTRLFVQPSLWEGFATLLSFSRANFPRYNFNFSTAEADRRAIVADFNAIYQDFAAVTLQFEQLAKASA